MGWGEIPDLVINKRLKGRDAVTLYKLTFNRNLESKVSQRVRQFISVCLWSESCHVWLHFIQLGKNILIYD